MTQVMDSGITYMQRNCLSTRSLLINSSVVNVSAYESRDCKFDSPLFQLKIISFPTTGYLNPFGGDLKSGSVEGYKA